MSPWTTAFVDVKREAREWLDAQGCSMPIEGASGRLADLWRQLVEREGMHESEFYLDPRVSLEYIGDLVVWHSEFPGPRKMSKAMAQNINGPRVLDYGGGIGSTTIALSEIGYDVSYHEVGPVLREFAEHRVTERGLSVDMAPDLGGKWDAIVAIDVIEHLPAPADFIKWCHGHLNPNGELVATWVFHKHDGCPQHIGINDPRVTEFSRVKRQYFHARRPNTGGHKGKPYFLPRRQRPLRDNT